MKHFVSGAFLRFFVTRHYRDIILPTATGVVGNNCSRVAEYT